MKNFRIFGGLLAVLVCLSLLTTSCRRRPNSLTYIPGKSHSITNELVRPIDENLNPNIGMKNPDGSDMDPNKTGGIPQADRTKRESFREDREYFKANTVYFEFDKAAVQKKELDKVQAVGQALKSRPEISVEVEGHCDERGTEEYNRSLSEKRALSVREYLINLGISPERVFTVSFGEDKPAVNAHNEAAWAKNRRAEFILLLPKN